ncbi:RNA polymerase II C-terminal domain kinase beta subunit [Coemansia sp. RSA 1933]|nr:RNA polymerase II C-terminal domain kinase beta subunit [Coemansia sp. RSA 1933]
MPSSYILAQLKNTPSVSGSHATHSNSDHGDNSSSSTQLRSDQQEIFDNPAMQTATKCCISIKEVSRKLGFPARTISTAQLLVYRTYIYRPSTRIGSTDMATACLFVASKMEETIKKLRDISAHSYIILTKPQPSSSDPKQVPSAVIDKMRPSILNAEQLILEAIGYDFRTSHAHLLFVKLAKMAGLASKSDIATSGWAILSDAYFTTLPVQYPLSVISAGSLCLAWCVATDEPEDTCIVIRSLFTSNDASGNGNHANGRDLGPPKIESKRPLTLTLAKDDEWWVRFGVSTADIQGFVKQMVDFYLLFFNSTVATTEYLERHKHGIPSKEMAQKIAQWRMKVSNA